MVSLQNRLKQLRYVGWDLGVRALERVAGHTRGDSLDFHLGTSARDLLNGKSRALRTEVDALCAEVQALRQEVETVAGSLVQAGSDAAPEDAIRAVRSLRAGLRHQLSPELVQRLSERLPEAEAAKLRKLLHSS